MDLSKLKAFADDKTNVTQKQKFAWGRVKKSWENAGYKHFLLFPHFFKRLLSQGRQESELCDKSKGHWVEENRLCRNARFRCIVSQRNRIVTKAENVNTHIEQNSHFQQSFIFPFTIRQINPNLSLAKNTVPLHDKGIV